MFDVINFPLSTAFVFIVCFLGILRFGSLLSLESNMSGEDTDILGQGSRPFLFPDFVIHF